MHFEDDNAYHTSQWYKKFSSTPNFIMWNCTVIFFFFATDANSKRRVMDSFTMW